MKTNDTFGIYVHWPYCARICPYCDFNVYKNKAVDAAEWAKALHRDLEYWASRTPNRKLKSLYFGGGTPSLAPLSVIEQVIADCERLWGFSRNPEITIEANPTGAEQSLYKSFASLGVNRLSLGIQSLRNDALKFLGRDHNRAEAIQAIRLAADTFDHVTFDLIYARRDQTLTDWRDELTEALAFGVSHLSLYNLTIEPGTAFGVAVEKGRWRPPEDDLCADMYDLAQELTGAAGMPAYEISNHARPGHESQHNLIYWRYDEYLGIGPGAHGRVVRDGKRLATEAILSPKEYLQAKSADETFQLSDLTTKDETIERLSMGLRLTKGVPFTPSDPYFQLADAEKNLQHLINDGLLKWDKTVLSASTNGRRILNRVLYELFG